MESNKVFLEKNKVFKNNELNVLKFNELDTKIQANVIKLILEEIYTGTKKIEVDNKYVLKCLKLTCDEFDNNIHLPLGLLVKKQNNTISFEFQKKVPLWFFIALLGILLFTIVGATYSAFNYIKLRDLNKDIDGDGIADINIDINKDEVAEINIDLDSNDKPEINIDYMSNRIPTFNIIDGDNILNPTNVLDDEGFCVRNCDNNKDGWPETNLDLNGDEKITINKDLNKDGIPDMNIDQDGDGICDLHCDTDNDDICDLNCLEDNSGIVISINGTTEIVGKTTISHHTANLEIIYTDLSDVVVENILPDDMVNQSIPIKEFTVKNPTRFYVLYSLKWVDVRNTFIRDNFKFKVDCEKNCKTLDFTTAPKDDKVFLSHILIPPNVTHSYKISFKLHGTNEPQDYDKDKSFRGKVEVVYEEYRIRE